MSFFGNLRKTAQVAYQQFVAEGMTASSPWRDLRGQVYLGSDNFLREIRARIEQMEADSEQISSMVRSPDRPTAAQIIKAGAQAFAIPTHGLFDRKALMAR